MMGSGTSNPDSPVALITGSAKPGRIGHAIAKQLARRGYHIVLHGHRHAEQAEQTIEEFKAIGIPAIVIAADLADSAELDQLVNQSWQWQERLDVLEENKTTGAYSVCDA